MHYRSIAIAALSTTVGIAAVQATTAFSAFRWTSPRASVEVPASSMEAAVQRVVMTADGPVVLLQAKNTERALPIWIGNAEARAIERARQGIRTPRPMTHDLFTKTLERLDAEVVHVRVDRLRADGVYVGTITIRQGEEVRAIDARPSDSMALALRTGAKIYIADKLQRQMILSSAHH